MLAGVVRAERKNGISKRTNKDYDAVITHVVIIDEKDPNKKEVEIVWIDPNLLGGYLPEYGAVLDLQYDRHGYLIGVTVEKNKKFSIQIENA